MKKIRMVQNVMILVGLITAVALADGLEVSSSNKWAAFVIVMFTLLIVIERSIQTESK
ncbi:hypothetical protein [Bacteroides nordii]|uniref:hypothetical protein n=1 Tax=Bacteroides nordii TaxID=291645 RepID=UPI0035230F81